MDSTMSLQEFMTRVERRDCFSHVFLHGGTYDGVTLDGADLSGLSMVDSSFVGAVFKRVKMDGAWATGIVADNTVFEECIITHTPFNMAQLRSATIRNCHITRGGWKNVEMEGSTFESCELNSVIFGSAMLPNSVFERTVLEECDIMEANLRGTTFKACVFRNMWITELSLTETSFHDCRFEDVDFADCDVSGVDLCGSDLEKVRFGGRENSKAPTLTGAKYDANTKFPEGFDPVSFGMVEVPVAGDSGKRPVEVRANREEIALDEPEILEGTFLAKPVGPSESILGLLGNDQWPPKDYDGAEADRNLAEQLGEILSDLVESSDVDLSYTPFVLRPGADLEAVIEDDVLTVPADKVMLAIESAELAEAEAKNPDWWTEFYKAEEYETRIRASQLMAGKLKNVTYTYTHIPDGWAVSWYWGISEAGSIVGVLAPRYDAD